MDKTELKSLDIKTLEKEILSLKRELFDLKLSVASGGVKDTSQFRKLRIKIAQALTFLGNQKRFQGSDSV